MEFCSFNPGLPRWDIEKSSFGLWSEEFCGLWFLENYPGEMQSSRMNSRFFEFLLPGAFGKISRSLGAQIAPIKDPTDFTSPSGFSPLCPVYLIALQGHLEEQLWMVV